MTRRKKVIVSLLAVAILGSVITFGASQIYPSSSKKAKSSAVYVIQKAWDLTGFYDKQLWDWFELLAVPILIVLIGYQLEQRDKRKAEEQEAREKERAEEQKQLEKEKAEKQAEVERQIAKDNLAEEAIQAYLDRMSDLLLNKELRKDLLPNVNDKLNPSGYDNPVRDVARTQTTTILRRLEGDKDHQARILDFLRDAELYQFIFQNANLSKIDLSQADLKEANLQGAHLWDTNLQGALLYKANLQRACLTKANLQKANLLEANLQGANLLEADLQNKQIKLACFWEKVIYKGERNKEKKAWEAIEPDNTNFIEELKNDTASDPKQPPDCSRWENPK